MKRKRNASKTTDQQIAWLIEELEKNRTPEYFKAGAGAIVILVGYESDARTIMSVLRHWASRDGFPIRMPHYSVSAAGLEGEAQIASGGLLFMDEFGTFSAAALGRLRTKVLQDSIPVGIVGVGVRTDEGEEGETQYIFDNADALGSAVIDEWGKVLQRPPGGRASAAKAVPPKTDMDVINRHRASIGMGPIDPAAGWTTQELASMAESIRKTGRMANPGKLKRRLMR